MTFSEVAIRLIKALSVSVIETSSRDSTISCLGKPLQLQGSFFTVVGFPESPKGASPSLNTLGWSTPTEMLKASLGDHKSLQEPLTGTLPLLRLSEFTEYTE